MLINKRFTLAQVAKWTRFETFIFIILAIIPAFLFSFLGQSWIQLPWTPVAVIGTAVAFVIGFQNNAAYGRIWEARKIWGGMVNTSRSWGVLIQDFVSNEYTDHPFSESDLNKHKKQITYRHLAWLTALRYEMRESRPWEVSKDHKTMKEWEKILNIPERNMSLQENLSEFLSKDELEIVLAKNNKPTAILTLQSKHLRELKEKNIIWEFSFLQLEELIVEMFNLQGMSERIKNFPYPRQYATIAHFFIWTFLILLPYSVVPEFIELGKTIGGGAWIPARYCIWFSVPFVVIISWVFHTMERIGRVGENPFEGTVNDVPISTIARGIEIDLKQILGEQDIPKPYTQLPGIQM